jgi:NAD(P)-dependent dehydrogenase (short-subunit alcohol dehydrogenase family)
MALAASVGGTAQFVATDVTSDESVDTAIAAAVEAGPLRAAVIVHGGPAAGKRMVGKSGEPYPTDVEERWGSAVPNPRRMGETDEYARLAQHIVENDYLNGTTIRIDGALRFNI